MRLSLRWLLLLVLIGGLVLPQFALAATTEGIGISPTSTSLTVAPQKSSTGQITVYNNGNVGVRFHLYADNYSINSEAYDKSFYSSNDGLDPAASWINLPPKDQYLDVGQQRQFNYSVTPPTNASPGGHYAVIFAATITQADNNGLARVKRVGNLLYFTQWLADAKSRDFLE